MKKITILVGTLFMVFSLGACGKTKEDEAVVTQQESSMQIESIDEKMTLEDMSADKGDDSCRTEELDSYEGRSDIAATWLQRRKR